MPYGYGSANRRGPSGPPGGGATSRGSGRDFSPRPRAPTVTTGGPPSILSRPTPTPTPVTTGGPPGGGDPRMTYTAPPVTRGGGPPGGGDPRMTYTAPPVTRGGGPPGGGGGGGPSPGITHPFLRNKMIKKAALATKRGPTWKDWALSNINPWQLDDTYGEGAGSTLGARGIGKGLSNWFFDKGITSLQNLPESAKVWMAHATEPDDFAKLTKRGFESIRPTNKWTNLLSPRSYEELLRGKNPLTSTGVYTAVGKTKKEAMEAAAQYGKPWYSRGLGKGVDPSKVLVEQVARGTHPIHRGVTGVAQMEVPSHIANKLKAVDRFGKHTVGIGDKGLKVGAAPAKHLIKSTVGRMLPGVGAALGGASALKHLQAGNYGQAAMAGLSMAPGPLGWLGLAGEMGLGALQNIDTRKVQEEHAGLTGFAAARGGLANLYRYGGFIG